MTLPRMLPARSADEPGGDGTARAGCGRCLYMAVTRVDMYESIPILALKLSSKVQDLNTKLVQWQLLHVLASFDAVFPMYI